MQCGLCNVWWLRKVDNLRASRLSRVVVIVYLVLALTSLFDVKHLHPCHFAVVSIRGVSRLHRVQSNSTHRRRWRQAVSLVAPEAGWLRDEARLVEARVVQTIATVDGTFLANELARGVVVEGDRQARWCVAVEMGGDKLDVGGSGFESSLDRVNADAVGVALTSHGLRKGTHTQTQKGISTRMAPTHRGLSRNKRTSLSHFGTSYSTGDAMPQVVRCTFT